MIVDMKKMASELKVRLPDLITRPVGKRMYARVKKQMGIISEGEIVLLDFAGIKVIDSSFVDEFLIQLILDSRLEPAFFLKIAGVSDTTEVNIDAVFSSFTEYNSGKIAVITDRITRNNSCYIGTLSKSDKDVIDFLHVNRRATMNDIASFSGISEEAAGAIAEELYVLRMVRREKNSGHLRYCAL
jgi:hypothetical protein